MLRHDLISIFCVESRAVIASSIYFLFHRPTCYPLRPKPWEPCARWAYQKNGSRPEHCHLLEVISSAKFGSEQVFVVIDGMPPSPGGKLREVAILANMAVNHGLSVGLPTSVGRACACVLIHKNRHSLIGVPAESV